MRTKIFTSLIFLFFFLIGISQNVLATDVTTCQPITVAGTYTLQNDLNSSSYDDYCINITSDNVILDLNSKTIDILPEYGVPVSIRSDDTTNVTIKNGIVKTQPIVFYNVSYSFIENVDMSLDSVGIVIRAGSNNVTVNNVEVVSKGSYGIILGQTDGASNITMRDSQFKNAGVYDIRIFDLCSNTFGCGLDYDTILDQGVNSSITTSPCTGSGNITLDISVFDGTLIHLPPDDYCNSVPNATVCVNGDCLYNYTHIENDTYCVSGYPPKDLYVFQFNITSGIKTVTANWEGYVPFSEEKYYSPDYNVSKNIVLYPYVFADIELTVRDAHYSYIIPSALHSLFYSNGTCVNDIWLDKCMEYYTWSDGTGRFVNLELNEKYYYIVQKTGYKKYNSDIFNLTANVDHTVYLIPTEEFIILDINPKVAEASTLLNFTVDTSIMPPFYVYVDCIDGGELSVQWASNVYNSSKIVQGSEFLYSGTYVCTATIKDYTSNSVQIKVEGIEETASEFGYFAFILSPIFISTILLLGFSGFIEYQVKAGGRAFMLTFLVISLILTILGIYPWWLGFVLIVVSGVLIVKFIFGAF